MILNDNFIIRDLLGVVLLVPVKNNLTSNDPIYINNVVYEIIKHANQAENRSALCDMMTKRLLVKDESDINALKECIDQLIAMDIIREDGMQ